MSKTPTRLYTVKHNTSGKIRLVEATNPNPALSHVARDEYTVEVADAKEAAVLAATGTRIETAGVAATDATPVPVTVGGTNLPASSQGVIDQESVRLYEDAVTVVRDLGRVSISLVQSRLAVGYNLAATLVERMEAQGIVSAPALNGERTVLPTAA